MSEEEIYTIMCSKCGKEVLCSESHCHYVQGMKGAKTLCHWCEREFLAFTATFFKGIE